MSDPRVGVGRQSARFKGPLLAGQGRIPTIPQLDSPKRRKGAAAPSMPAGAPRVLMIDDNEGITKTFALFLGRQGLEVETATSGAAGLTLVLRRAGGFHAIVADQCLPDITGLEVVTQLRAVGCRIPVVMVSGWRTPELQDRASQLGVSAFLQRPVFLDELLHELLLAVQIEVPAVAPEALHLAEPPSRAMTEMRAFAAALAPDGTSPVNPALVPADAAEAQPRLLRRLLHAAVSPNLSVREFAAVASAIRVVTTAPDDTIAVELAPPVLEALARAGASDLRRPLHAKVVEALAHFARVEGWSRELSEPDVAGAVHLSVSRLSRLLHPQTGLDFHQWKRGFRMRGVAHRLACTQNDVSEIARSMGYKHENQLDDDFHRVFGLTPREFRRILRAATPT